MEQQGDIFGDFSQPGIMTSIIVYPVNADLEFQSLDDHIGDKDWVKLLTKLIKNLDIKMDLRVFSKLFNLKKLFL